MALLRVDKVEEPFTLEVALTYMRKYGEFIRCKTEEQDFYMYLENTKRPSIHRGKREWQKKETVWAFTPWGTTHLNFSIGDIFKECFYLMRFDEKGEPDWSDPTKEETSDSFEKEISDEGSRSTQ